MTRSRARRLASLGFLSAVAGAVAMTGASAPVASSQPSCVARPPADVVDGLRTPDVRVSRNGVLETTLRASYGPVELGGGQYQTMSYEGTVPGPTLVVCPGDRLVIHVVNDLGGTPPVWLDAVRGEHRGHASGQLTNLHTHGLHVSPEGNSDNVFVEIPPGETFTYGYQIPEDHPPGLSWYHPHRHGYVQPQLYAGMFGAIIVQGGLDDLPELAAIPTRTLEISSLQLGDGEVVPVHLSETPLSPYFVNGMLEPDLTIRPGEVQRWRILNANTNAIVRLRVDGHTMRVLATDGNTLEEAIDRKKLLIGPGERREVLIRGGPAGVYGIESLDFAQFQDGMLPGSTIARLHSVGDPVDQAMPRGDDLTAPAEDLRDAPVDERHRLVFSERQVGPNEWEFLINGKTFDANRVDETMRLGEVHEWVIVNASEEWHTFHIHVNDFQVTGFSGDRVPRVSNGRESELLLGPIDPEDTVKIPPGGTVTMRTRPTDFTGKFVFHCHMTNHEDRGMMGVVTVEPA